MRGLAGGRKGGYADGVLIAIVMPVYNERALVAAAVARLEATTPPLLPLSGLRGRATDNAMERCRRVLVLVDDGSTDGSTEIVREMGRESADESGMSVVAVVHERNQGKGAALKTGIRTALDVGADVVIVHDADLEYDPADHHDALAPILDGRADAVIGTRFRGAAHRVLYYWHYVANGVITTFSNMLTNLNLSDIECCTKAFTRAVAQRLVIRERAFGVEPELIARLAKMRLPASAGEGGGHEAAREGGTRALRIFEVPVSYAGRTYAEGKKIAWRDGVRALYCIVRYNWWD